MGVEPRSAEDVIALAHDATDAGLDGIQVYSLDLGHGYRPRPTELERYLDDVLSAIGCPAVLSSHQAMGYALPAALVSALARRHEHVVGINFTNPSIPALVEMLDALDGSIELHVGGPMQATAALALGASGFLSSEANLAPRLCMQVVAAHNAGNLATRDEAFGRVLRLFSETQRQGGVSATKAALRELGLPGGYPRRPRLDVDTEAGDALASCFRRLGLEMSELR